MNDRMRAARKVANGLRREALSQVHSSQPFAPNPATEPTATAASKTRCSLVLELSYEIHLQAQISSKMGLVPQELRSFRAALSTIPALRKQMLELSSLRRDLDALKYRINHKTTVVLPEQSARSTPDVEVALGQSADINKSNNSVAQEKRKNLSCVLKVMSLLDGYYRRSEQLTSLNIRTFIDPAQRTLLLLHVDLPEDQVQIAKCMLKGEAGKWLTRYESLWISLFSLA
ncbi:unnamed protein product [Agarophyton chilense]